MKYRLKDVTNRKSVILTGHSKNITAGVTFVFLHANVKVHNNYFEIVGMPATVSNGDLRKMGQEIANRDTVLHNLAKVYNYTRSDGTSGKSVQLFEQF
ncbi:hypothetical protein [Clostridium psychrophilum]|uniref:hypothetical protein n=1 Tax=Clostridium psychrophilum TaxID=132926 RepID=UPI001C0B0286|nr:hypothetical protein [Clostridium psychrophilum]MBU3180658.1 hypothetical protein [Clostridium psychrophilum]